MPYDRKVNYLGYDGYQYLDTGITPNQTIEVEIKFMPTNTYSNSCALFGCRNGTTNAPGTGNYPLQIWYSGKNIALNDNNYDSGWRTLLTFDTEYIAEIKSRSLYVNGVLAVSSGRTNNYSYSLTYGLLRGHLLNDTWDSRRGSSGRIYYCKIWKDGALVRDFIPVVKDNVGYLYDKIGGELYANRGTGSFTYG